MTVPPLSCPIAPQLIYRTWGPLQTAHLGEFE